MVTTSLRLFPIFSGITQAHMQKVYPTSLKIGKYICAIEFQTSYDRLSNWHSIHTDDVSGIAIAPPTQKHLVSLIRESGANYNDSVHAVSENASQLKPQTN